MREKIIVLLGPTASGKTALSIKLAKKYNGEIISADSRQIYKGLDWGSGKITKKEMQGVPHYLLDVANPRRRFTVAQYQKLALKAVKKIHTKNKLPIIVGGTGFYIQSVVDGIVLPEVKPNPKLRESLERKSILTLYKMLVSRDRKRALSIDKYNKRRLIRALEIVAEIGEVPRLKKSSKFDVLQIGIIKPPTQLKKLIATRLHQRLTDIIKEVKGLHFHGLSWKRLEELGLEYRFVAQYLQAKITKEMMLEKLQKESEHFAKRQMTWFRRDKRIHWIGSHNKAHVLLDKFIDKRDS